MIAPKKSISYLKAWPTYLFLNMSGERIGSDLHLLTWIATAHPLTRLPVFLMGVVAGLASSCSRVALTI